MQKDIKNAMKRYIAKTDLNAHGFIRYDMVVKECNVCTKLEDMKI